MDLASTQLWGLKDRMLMYFNKTTWYLSLWGLKDLQPLLNSTFAAAKFSIKWHNLLKGARCKMWSLNPQIVSI